MPMALPSVSVYHSVPSAAQPMWEAPSFSPTVGANDISPLVVSWPIAPTATNTSEAFVPVLSTAMFPAKYSGEPEGIWYRT